MFSPPVFMLNSWLCWRKSLPVLANMSGPEPEAPPAGTLLCNGSMLPLTCKVLHVAGSVFLATAAAHACQRRELLQVHLQHETTVNIVPFGTWPITSSLKLLPVYQHCMRLSCHWPSHASGAGCSRWPHAEACIVNGTSPCRTCACLDAGCMHGRASPSL